MVKKYKTDSLRMERRSIVDSFHEIYKKLDFRTVGDVAQEITYINKNLKYNTVADCLNGKPVGYETLLYVSQYIANIMKSKIQIVENHYNNDRNITQKYVLKLIAQLGSERQEKVVDPVLVPTVAEKIFDNWNTLSNDGHSILKSGAYQLIRRYKPFDPSRPVGEHPVIFEMLFVDSARRDYILITSRRNIYAGTAFINHKRMVSCVLQRKSERKVHHRFLMQQLEDVKLPLYSGICLKTGDTSGRPVASECLFVTVPEVEHEDLYKELRDLMQRSGDLPEFLDANSVIDRYISANPPNEKEYKASDVAWKRVKLLKDFPALTQCATILGPARFREPIRAIGKDAILETSDLRMSVFQWS